MGTDLPEVNVSISASVNQLKGVESSGIITGYAIGSAISQITVILGIEGLLLNFRITKEDLLRDRHMSETVNRLMGFHGKESKIIIWEHNTHIGDARATTMKSGGLINVGQLAKD